MKQESKEDKIGRVKALQVEIQELLGRVYDNQKSIIKLLDEINKANIPTFKSFLNLGVRTLAILECRGRF